MIGAKATNALSEEFIAASTRNGVVELVQFKKGEFKNFKTAKAEKGESGTTVRFKPDATIFSTIELNTTKLKSQLRELSYLCKNLEMVFIDRRTDKPIKEVYKSERGLLDYIEYLNEKKETITTPFYLDALDTNPGVEIAFMYNNSYSDTMKLYTNNIPNKQGTHISGFRAGFTRAINSYGKSAGIIKQNDAPVNTDDLREGLVIVLNLKMNDPVYQGQTKENLTSAEGRSYVETAVRTEIVKWLERNPDSAKAILDKALSTRRAREAAKRARDAARKTPTASKNVKLPGKSIALKHLTYLS